MSDNFTGELWRGVADIYAAILAHPFLAGLTDGSLEPDAFAFYVVQDALYLRGYAQALAAVASRAPDTAGIEMFAGRMSGVLSPFSHKLWITAAINRSTPRVRWNFSSVDQSV